MVHLTQSLGWIINQKSELKPTQIFSFMSYEYHLDLALVKPTREMAQTSWFDPMLKVKTCFDCKMFDVANWVASLNGEDSPGGKPSREVLSVSPQDILSHWTASFLGQRSAHLELWQNPANVMKDTDHSTKDHKYHSIEIFTDASNNGWALT